MSISTPFALLHEAATARFPGEPQPGGHRADGTLHLYHAANSICSQKVRTVLAHTGTPYKSHPINIFEGENYHPSYVHMRMAGCLQAGLPLADRHLGTTSVASGGCDACVVPTLVDAAAESILVDSLRICLALDRSGALALAGSKARIGRNSPPLTNCPTTRSSQWEWASQRRTER